MIPNLVLRSVGEGGEGFHMKTFILKELRVFFPSSDPMEKRQRQNAGESQSSYAATNSYGVRAKGLTTSLVPCSLVQPW